MGVDRNIKIWLLLTKKVCMTALNNYYEPTGFQVIKPQNDLSKVYVSCGLKIDQVIGYFVLVLILLSFVAIVVNSRLCFPEYFILVRIWLQCISIKSGHRPTLIWVYRKQLVLDLTTGGLKGLYSHEKPTCDFLKTLLGICEVPCVCG